MRLRPLRVGVACALAIAVLVSAAARAAEAGAAAGAGAGPATQGSPGSRMDYGSFLAYSVSEDPGPLVKGRKAPARVDLANKGLTIEVGNGAAVCFDEDTCRMAAGWTGGFLNLSKTHQASLKGSWDATPGGPIAFSTKPGPGWANDGSFNDPRPHGIGPLPKEWAHYKGLYRHGKQVVLSYSVGDVEVLESTTSLRSNDQVMFVRAVRVGPSESTMRLCAIEMPGMLRDEQSAVAIDTADGTVTGFVLPAMKNSVAIKPLASSKADVAHLQVELPPHKDPLTFFVLITKGPPGETSQQAMDCFPDREKCRMAADLPSLCHGGPSRWNASITTEGRLAPPGNKPYVVDTLTLPDDNPWHSWMRPSGFDFLPDGRCAVCTLGGDVWIVSGVDKGLKHLTWKRFATGLYEPLGLKVRDGQIFVLGRDQITRLHDLDGDGEADFYENFNNDVPTYPVYHAFHFDLQTDSRGNFWYTTDGNSVPSDVPMHAAAIKVAYDGSKAEAVATGLRAANGCAMGPNDEFVCGDNQGNWTPACRINWIKPGGFYGFCNTPPIATPRDIANERQTYDVPLCWIPYEKDNSTGGQAFVPTDGRWGPLSGRMVSTSYGKARLFECIWEDCEGVMQGATVELPLNFESGIMRARFNPADGQLYVCGLKGWETNGSRDGCLQRVRYTGKQACLPTALHVGKDELAITFACPLDPKTANDEQSFGIEQYNYRWSAKYGSSKYKVSDPKQVGTDEVEVKSAKLMPDGRTVALKVPGLRPVMQMSIQVHLNAVDGAAIECEIDNTINHVPGLSAPAMLTAR
jgi:hypothetical protein